MDLIEILVVITAIALVALLGAVVIVSIQSLFNRSSGSKSSQKKQTNLDDWEEEDPSHVMESAPDSSSRTAPKVVVDETDLFIDEVMDFDPDENEEVASSINEGRRSISNDDLDAVLEDNDSVVEQSHEDVHTEREAPVEMDKHFVDQPVSVESDHEETTFKSEGRMEPTLNVTEFEAGHEPERIQAYPFMAGRPLLTPIERLFYSDLKATVAEKAEIFPKVRALDVINPKSTLESEDVKKASEQLLNQRFDFVLCDPDDFSVLCIIELEGTGDDGGFHKLEREVLQRSAESAALPVVLVDTRLGYTRKELKERIRYLLPKNATSFINELLPDQNQASSSIQQLQNTYVNGRHAYDSDLEDAAIVNGSHQQTSPHQSRPTVAYEGNRAPYSSSLVEREALQQNQSAFRNGTGHTPRGSSEKSANAAMYEQSFVSIHPVSQVTPRAPWVFDSRAGRPDSDNKQSRSPSHIPIHRRPQQSASKSRLNYTNGEGNQAPAGYHPQRNGVGAMNGTGVMNGKSSTSADQSSRKPAVGQQDGSQQGYYSNSGYSAEKYRNYRANNLRNSSQSTGYYQNANQRSQNNMRSSQGNGYSTQQARQATQQGSHFCPKCGSMLRLSMATRGQYQGQYFWVCSNMPNCSYVGPTESGR